MIFIRTVALTKDYGSKILRLWNSNFGEEFRITDNMLMTKVFEDVDLFLEGSFLLYNGNELGGFVISKTNVCGLPGYEDCGWISSLLIDKGLQGNGFGSDLYNKAEAALLAKGIKKIIIGGESDNFFSGIPCPIPQKLEFFRKLGFVINGDEHYDLIADVSAIDFEKYSSQVGDEDTFYCEVFKVQDTSLLDSFFEKSFPDRWKYEVMGYINNGGDPGNVIVLRNKEDIVGFCRINISSSSEDEILYGPCKGSLGPIGVSEVVRGKGLGRRILLESLIAMKLRGAHKVIIDWTILKDFYGQFEFVPYRTYRGAYKLL